MILKLLRWGNGQEYPEEFKRDRGALFEYFRTGDAAAVRKYLTAQPKWLGYYFFESSLLHHAAEHDHPEILAVLVDLGLDVNTPKEVYPWGALDEAVSRGHLNSARWLLEHGAKTTYEYRGLIFSCGTLAEVAQGNLEMVKLLVEHGAPVDILVDDPPRSLLTTAIEFGQEEIADYLRSRGALTEDEIRARAKAAKRKK